MRSPEGSPRLERTVIVLLVLSTSILLGGITVNAQEDNIKTYTNGYLAIHALLGNGVIAGENVSYGFTVSTWEKHPAPFSNVFYDGDTMEPWSSYITILVQDMGKAYVSTRTYSQFAHDENGNEYEVVGLDQYPASHRDLGNGYTVTWSLDDGLKVTQTVTIIGSTLDTSIIIHEVRVANTGGNAHTVGVRYLWDIMIANQDGSYLRIWKNGQPATEWLTTEYKIENPGPGMIWQTADYPQDPTFVIWGGITLPEGVTPPDMMIYGDWVNLYDNAWHVNVSTDNVIAGDDTAIAYYWMPVKLNPGQELRVVEALLPVTTGGELAEEPPQAAETNITEATTGGNQTTTSENTQPAQEETPQEEQAPAQQEQAQEEQQVEEPAGGEQATYCLSQIQLLIVLLLGVIIGLLLRRR